MKAKGNGEVFYVTKAVMRTVRSAIKVAMNYQDVTGRRLGITAEVGEVLAAKKLKLRLAADSIQKGFDAVDQQGKKFQIKSRRSQDENLPKESGRTGRFSKHRFDYALLVILSSKYEIIEIWRLGFHAVMRMIGKSRRRDISIHKFKSKADKIFPKQK